MILAIDTCFWAHLQDLYNEILLDLRSIFKEFKWGFTKEVKKEILHDGIDSFVNMDDAYLIPVSQGEINQMQELYSPMTQFDLADQTLIIAASRDSMTVLTDDGALLMECTALKIQASFLPVFCLALVKSSHLSKNHYAKCLKFWEEQHRYSIKHIKKWRSQLSYL